MAETMKKASTLRKPRTSTKAAESKPKLTLVDPTAEVKPEKAARKTAAGKNSSPTTSVRISHEEIARLAHKYWEERGGQHGHDAEDWLRAESELQKAS